MARIIAMRPLAARLLFNATLVGGLIMADALLSGPLGLLARAGSGEPARERGSLP